MKAIEVMIVDDFNASGMFDLHSMSPGVERLLADYGLEGIVGISVFRIPLAGALRTAIEILQGKKFDHEILYHVFQVIFTETRAFRVDKNAVVDVQTFMSGSDMGLAGVESMVVRGVREKRITVDEYFTNAERYHPVSFWKYNPESANCQKFVMWCLRGNQIDVPLSLIDFFYQDVSIPMIALSAMTGITSIAGVISRIYGSVTDRKLPNRSDVIASQNAYSSTLRGELEKKQDEKQRLKAVREKDEPSRPRGPGKRSFKPLDRISWMRAGGDLDLGQSARGWGAAQQGPTNYTQVRRQQHNDAVRGQQRGKANQWMAQLGTEASGGALRLCDLAIPGSHDSGTFSLRNHSAFGPDAPSVFRGFIGDIMTDGLKGSLVLPWSRAQNNTIQQQLEIGVRYLDIRLACVRGGSGYGKHTTYWITHGLMGTEFWRLLRDVVEWCKTNPTEVVIMDINHIYGIGDFNGVHGLAEFREYVLGGSPTTAPGLHDVWARAPDLTPKSTLNDFWEQKKNLILIVDPVPDSAPCPSWGDGIWAPCTIVSQWPNAQNFDELKSDLPKFGPASGKLRVTQLQLTPNDDMVKANLFGSTGLLRLAHSNMEIVKWLTRESGLPFNIVIADYVDEEWCRTLFETNFRSKLGAEGLFGCSGMLISGF